MHKCFSLVPTMFHIDVGCLYAYGQAIQIVSFSYALLGDVLDCYTRPSYPETPLIRQHKFSQGSSSKVEHFAVEEACLEQRKIMTVHVANDVNQAIHGDNAMVRNLHVIVATNIKLPSLSLLPFNDRSPLSLACPPLPLLHYVTWLIGVVAIIEYRDVSLR